MRMTSIAVFAILSHAMTAKAEPAALTVNGTDINLQSEHVEASYRQIADNANKIFARPITSSDYYTGLRIKANLNTDNITRSCKRNVGRGWYYVVSATINYHGKIGRPPVQVVPTFPILTAATNYSLSDKKLLPGCTLKVMGDRPPLYILNDNFSDGTGEYEITLEPLLGQASEPGIFQKVASLGLKVVAGWGSIAVPQAEAISEAAKELDFLRGAENKSDLQYRARIIPEGYPRDDAGVKIAQRIAVSFPWAIAAKGKDAGDIRYLAFYSRRSASIILDWANGKNPDAKSEITSSKIAFNSVLGARHDCFLGTDNCKEAAFNTSLAVQSPLQITAEYSDAEKGPALWSALHIYCKDIRDTVEKLSFATVDRLLMRWAILTRAGFIDDKRAFVGDGSAFKTVLEKVKIGGPGLGGQCWTAKDTDMLEAIETASNKKFVP